MYKFSENFVFIFNWFNWRFLKNIYWNFGKQRTFRQIQIIYGKYFRNEFYLNLQNN